MRFTLFLLLSILGLHLFISRPSQSQDVSIQLPDTVALETPTITVPITVDDLTGMGLISFEFTMSFDSTVIRVDDVLKESYLSEVFALLDFNATQPGKVIVAGASGGTPLAGEGQLLGLQLTFLREGVSDLVFEDFKFDPGNPSTNLTHGRVRNTTLTNRDQHKRIPSSFSLLGNYPNPFGSHTRIILDLHEPALVGIEVFNMQGKRLIDVPYRQMYAGSNQRLELNASSIPAGIYFYSVSAYSQSGYHAATKFITVIR